MFSVLELDGMWVCRKCGARAPGIVDGRPLPPPESCNCKKPGVGLGDMVASGLAAVGITKERVQAVAAKVGVKDCGCAKRQKALNELGAKLGLPPGQS